MRTDRSHAIQRLGATAIALSLLATGGCATLDRSGDAAAGDEITLRIAHTAKETEPYQIGFDAFGEELEKLSDGSIQVDIFANGQLGDEESVLNAIRGGSVSMTTVSNSVLSASAPEMTLFDLPFVFDSPQDMWKTAAELAPTYESALEAEGYVLLGFYYAGARNILNNQKPVNSLADFKDMTVRVIPSQTNIESMKALGASPQPIEYSELYTALQTDVVDAAEAANSNYYSQRFYEVAPHWATVEWQYLAAPVVIGKDLFDSMSEEQRDIVRTAMENTLEEQHQAYISADAAALTELEESGDIKVTQPDRAEWVAASRPVWDRYADVVGRDTLDDVLALNDLAK